MNEAQKTILNQMIDNKKLSAMLPYNPSASSYREHDCWHYTECVYKIGSEGTARVCQTCEKILEFRYRGFWKRLLRVFIDF